MMNWKLGAFVSVAVLSAAASAQSVPTAVPVPFATVGAGTGQAGTSTCSTGILSTAGTTLGDGCAPATAGLNAPQGVWVDAYNNIYIADYQDRAVRVVYNGGTALAAAITAANSGFAITASRNAPAPVPVPGNVYTLAGFGASTPTAITAVSGKYPCANYNGTNQPTGLNSLGDGCPGTAAIVGPRAVTTDADGNVFIMDYTNARVRVLCVNCAANSMAAQMITLQNPTITAPANGSIYTLVGVQNGYRDATIGSGGATAAASTAALLRSPTGISVSATDDVYIADNGNNAVRLLYNGGSAALALLTAEGITPTKGYVYTIAGAGCVSADSAHTGSVSTANACSLPTTNPPASPDNVKGNASAVNTPWSIYLDPNSNVYISDSGNSKVRVLYGGIQNPLTISGTLTTGNIYTFAGGGSSTANGIAPTQLQFAPTAAQGVGGDASGNIFLVDYLRQVIMEVYAQTGTLTTIAGGGTVSAPGGTCAGSTGPAAANAYGDGCPGPQSKLNAPRGTVAVGTDGTLYFGDSSNSVVQAYRYNASFPATNVGSSSVAQPYAFTFNAAATLGTQPVSFTTGDFASAGSGDTCTAGLSATQGSTCVVNVVSTPARPGMRLGAVSLAGIAGKVGTEPLESNGVGAGLTIDPGSLSSIGTGLAANGVAVDAGGAIYVADNASKSVLVYASPSSATATSAITGLTAPSGVVVDGGGNLFVVDAAANTLTELPAGGSAFVAIKTGLNAPHGLAVDAAGNVLIADTGNNRVAALAPNGTQAAALAITGLNAPQAVAVDAAGNIYVADTGNSRIVKFVPSTQTQSVVASVASNGVAVDAAGDVFAFSGSTLLMYPASGSAAVTVATGLSAPKAIALDGNGSAYVADSGLTSVVYDQRTTGAYTFTTSPSSTNFTLSSSGSAVLVPSSAFTTNTNATNFSVAPGTTNGCSGMLASGLNCSESATFQAAGSGSFTSTITFGTNATNGGATLALKGTTTAKTTTTLLQLSATSGNYGTSFTLSATVTSAGGTPAGTVTFFSGTKPLATATLDASGKASSTLVLPAGSLSITAAFSPSDTVYATSTSTQQTVIVAPGTLTVTANSITRGYGQQNPTLTYTITGFVSGETAGTATTGTPSITTTATAASSQGTYPIAAAQGTLSAGNYNFIFVNGTLTISKASPIITINANPTSIFSPAQVALTATIATAAGTPTGLVTFYSGATSVGTATLNATSGGASASLTTAALPVGTDSITAVYAGDTNFTTATSAATTVTVMPAFGVSSSSTTLTMPHGYQEVQAVLSINPGGRTDTLTFQCSGLPSQLSCAFSPSSVALSGQTSALTVNMLVSNSNAKAEVTPRGNGVMLALLPLSAMLLLVSRQRKMLPRLLLLMLATLGASAALTGCGSTAAPTQSAGSYNFTVNVMSGSTTVQTLNYTLTVQ